MRKVLLSFYNKRNIGDDLFVKLFAEYFSDCRVTIITGFKNQPKCLPKNVHMALFRELINVAINKLLYTMHNPKCLGFLTEWENKFNQWYDSRFEARVIIGGSIFMEHCGQKEMEISTDQSPQYGITVKPRLTSNRFVIGANIGPVYSVDYFERVKKH